jgi:hypothetical protein
LFGSDSENERGGSRRRDRERDSEVATPRSSVSSDEDGLDESDENGDDDDEDGQYRRSSRLRH